MVSRTFSRRHAPRSTRGVTLIELLVGLAISSLIIVGTVFVYSQSRTTYALNDRAARLQEYGRYAMSILEPDLQLAGYFGFSNNPSDLRFKDGTNEIPTSQLEQRDAPQIKTSIPAISTCGNNYVVDLTATVQGSNDVYGPACAAKYPYQLKTDTLTIRRASTAAVPASKTKLQLYVNELKRANQYIFLDKDAARPHRFDP